MDAATGVAVMINEEDHLRLQAIAPGMRLQETWERLDAIDSALEDLVTFAFHDDFGYLTACPSNVGTGLRASVMMQLPGLKLQGEVERVINGIERMGYTVRGVLGEGTEAHGNMFQVSNQQTMGDSEADILSRFTDIVLEVACHENHARLRLMESSRSRLLDWIARACAILQHAQVLASQETLDLLSAVRLGVEVGAVCGSSRESLDEIMLLTQRGHLQKILKKRLGPEDRDVQRAKLVREALQGLEFVDTLTENRSAEETSS